MRPSLWPGLVRTWIANRKRQQTRARLFEIGRAFLPDGARGHREPERIAGLLTGERLPEQWGAPGAAVDFYDLRGLVEDLLACTRSPESFVFEAATHPALHPGQCARVLRDGAVVGLLGRIHPRLQEELDLAQPLFLFELELEGLSARARARYEGLSRFPAVRRDLAIDLDAGVPADRVIAVAREAGGSIVTGVSLFDVYTGQGLEVGRRSLALAIVMQHPERTLEDAETADAVERMLEALTRALGARRR
jgi:phenylalanyl-tRNA synthetase beta chain